MQNTDSTPMRFARVAMAAAATAALGLGVAACGSDGGGAEDSTGPQSGEVNVVGYSTPTDAYETVLEPGYKGTENGAEVEFKNSFGASGDQSRAVEAGQKADFVHFALAPDVDRLVDAGVVADDWDDGEYGGTIQESVVAFTVRGGNPKDIQDWDDLLRDDVEVLVPNPFTSGGARWDIMAAYGQVIENGGSEEEAVQFVDDLLSNVVQQDASASDALETFTGGEGDVLISYESEALRAQDAGEDVDYVVPDSTIRIETKGAVLEDTPQSPNVNGGQSFMDYLLSPEGQQGFADEGFRPVDPDVLAENEDKFPTPKGLFDIEELGGWDTVTDEFFGEDGGIVTEIEQELGVPTA